MIDEVVKKVRGDKIQKIGILGTPSTIKSKLYQSALEKQGIKVFLPSPPQIDTLEEIIRNIIKGDSEKSDAQKLKNIADSLMKRGATAVILGCTELPLVFPKKYSLPIYNSVEILSKALLRKYFQGNTIEQGNESAR